MKKKNEEQKKEGILMIPKLNNEYIESARTTAFNPSSIDNIQKQYEDVALVIHKHIEEGKEDKLNMLCVLYNNYLLQLGSHVSPWVAGRSNYKAKSTTPIDKALRAITDYVEEIEAELKEIDYQKNKEKYDKQEKIKRTTSLINEIGYYQDINKTLFYKTLVELYEVDKDIFIKTYEHFDACGKIASNSKAAKLYKELTGKKVY